MNFVLAVHQPNDPHALAFARASLAAGHQLGLVFFYQDGVLAADRDSTVSSDWQQLAADQEVPLAVCIGAAARRELIDESAPEASERAHPAFEVVGLGQYIGALIEADRLITFPS